MKPAPISQLQGLVLAISLCLPVGTFLVGPLLVGCGAPAVAPPISHWAETPVDAVVQADSTSGQSDSTFLPAQSTFVPVGPISQQQAVPPENKPIRYTVRKSAPPQFQPAIPRVLLSAGHRKLCRVKVGDSFPSLGLPQLGGPTTELAALHGRQATVVLFWHPDRWMARTALIDMQRDIASQFEAEQVAVVGIAVRQSAGSAQAAVNQAESTFPQLLDADGRAFATVGTAALPRLFVLDPVGKIVWFDIEYSEGTRRELWQTLQALTKID